MCVNGRGFADGQVLLVSILEHSACRPICRWSLYRVTCLCLK
jgi:hypothetical protein